MDTGGLRGVAGEPGGVPVVAAAGCTSQLIVAVRHPHVAGAGLSRGFLRRRRLFRWLWWTSLLGYITAAMGVEHMP